MKVSCEIINDLLPLFHDGICSNESRAMVEKHLAECDNCKAELQSMGEIIPISNMEQNLSEADAIKKLSKKWRTGMLKSLLKGALITVLVIAVIAIVLFLFMDIRIFTEAGLGGLYE